MNAVIFAPYIRELGSSNSNDTIKAFLQKLSPFELTIGAVAGLMGCVAFGWVVYMLLRVFVARRRLPAATNTLGESVLALCLFVTLGRGAGLVLARLEWDDILVRMGATILTGAVCVGVLALMCRRRDREAVFSYWDLRPNTGGTRLFLMMPVVFLAFLPINFVVGFAWRCVLIACDRPTELQEVLLAPLERGGAVIPIFMAFAVGVVPLFEEILFRGGLYRALRAEIGPGSAALASSVVFAALHFNETALLPLVVLSLFFVAVYEWTGSLWACVVLHACFNGVNFTLA